MSIKAAPAAPLARRQRRAQPGEARPAHAGPHTGRRADQRGLSSTQTRYSRAVSPWPDRPGSGHRRACILVARQRLGPCYCPQRDVQRAIPRGVVLAVYPLMPWATCPWCADSCSAWSSSALRCGAPAELERRERERGDRTPGMAMAQEPLVHAHGRYDVECDTTKASPYDCAVRVRDFLRTGQEPTAFDRLRSQLL